MSHVRVLVTGGAGFAGRALCAHLVGEGLQVFAAGRTRSPFGTFVPLKYPAPDEDLSRVVAEVRPDFIFHLAGVVHCHPPHVFYETNTSFAAALLEALRRSGRACSVLLAGTSAEYGQVPDQDLPISEACVPRPYSHYGISKLAQTQLGLAFHCPDLRVVVTRTFNLVGPGMPSFLAVQAFIDQLIALARGDGEGVLKVGNLEASRDYLHVRTAVEAYWKLIRAEGAQGRVVNVCSGVPIRMADVVATLLDVAAAPVRVELDPARVKAVDMPVHYGDNRLLRNLTGMRPELDLRAALEEAYRHSAGTARDDDR